MRKFLTSKVIRRTAFTSLSTANETGVKNFTPITKDTPHPQDPWYITAFVHEFFAADQGCRVRGRWTRESFNKFQIKSMKLFLKANSRCFDKLVIFRDTLSRNIGISRYVHLLGLRIRFRIWQISNKISEKIINFRYYS